MKLPTASSLPRVFECLGSHLLPQIHSETEESRAGTEMHRFLQIAGEKGRDEALAAIDSDDEDLRADCELIDLDSLPVGANYGAEIGLAYDVQSGLVRELGRGLPRSEMYRTLTPTEFAGTFDIVGLSPSLIFVGDWKRGQYAPPAKRNWQVRFGAFAGARLWGRDAARAAVIQRVASRSPSWSVVDMDALDLEQIESELCDLHSTLLLHSVSTDPPPIREGSHCRHCSAWNACSAKTGLVKRLASGAEVEEAQSWLPITRQQVGVAWQRLRIAKEMMGRLEASIYAFIAENGPVELPNGMMLGERERRGNEVLDPKIARAVLSEMFGGDVANAASKFEVPKSGVERAIQGLGDGEPVAPRVRKVLDAIAERGGVSRKASTTRVEEYEPKEGKQ